MNEKRNVSWAAVEAFELESPGAMYGFVTRLSCENAWTEHFTLKAIEEYKKFMYLAAVSDKMVSPSEIVDVVWHQHLIFTDSYTQFCKLLGKRIEHIPSTHNRAEKQKFLDAKEHTQKLYEQHFGTQPEEIWQAFDALDTLPLQMPRGFLATNGISVSAFAAAMILPIFYFLTPTLVQIGNPYFLWAYLLFFLLVLAGIEGMLRVTATSTLVKIAKHPIIENLNPAELLSFKGGSNKMVIDAVVNQLVKDNKISIAKDFKLSLKGQPSSEDKYEQCVLNALAEKENIFYPELLEKLRAQPLFQQFEKSTNKIKTHFKQMKTFAGVQTFAIVSFIALWSIGISRFVLGMMHGKPITFLIIALMLSTLIFVVVLKRIRNYFFSKALPLYSRSKYAQEQLPIGQHSTNYLLHGNTALAAAFLPLVTYTNRNQSGGSCGSSCGSGGGDGGGGCGGGCGGCGG